MSGGLISIPHVLEKNVWTFFKRQCVYQTEFVNCAIQILYCFCLLIHSALERHFKFSAYDHIFILFSR